ncbi:TRAP transporter substrate-binding protein [Hellea sp.]|jgi:TRAP-type mannitol/chloroaromatic compound transport system substrate-binding protein|nr:TRAP transporter substrate-binding protein [Hellea sp.]MDA8888929.1 TRAP transporter substrate-binding protein [Hellea sp.]MDB4844442.1 TRAP transporter substrate-binding protein [Hellea sp.]MDC0650509.1 TRAP transporter substrate-binding protein [Hellea sp.]MDC1062673.1 TRAP transporter substrate-binding protein [Hellea sp.]
MKRRQILGAVAAVATGTTVTGILGSKNNKKQVIKKDTKVCMPNISKGVKRFRMVTTWPKDFPGLGQMPNRFAKALKDMTSGLMEVKVYSAGELVGAMESFDATASGAADMYHGAEYYWQGKSKGFSFFTSVPMGMTAAEIMGWIDHGGGQKLWDNLSANFNIKPFQAGNTGHQTGGWFKKKINTLDDFKGLKMRMPGLGGEVIRRLGGAAVQLSGGEIYQALQSGSIDATEWVGPWNDYAFGFYREAPYYYAPGFHEPGASLAVGINLDIWNNLSNSEQSIIKYACKSANDTSLGEYTHENAKALEILKINHGIYPRYFTDEIMKEIGKISNDVVFELGNSDSQTATIYESYIKARNSYNKWTEMSDGLYINARKISAE